MAEYIGLAAHTFIINDTFSLWKFMTESDLQTFLDFKPKILTLPGPKYQSYEHHHYARSPDR